MTRPTVKHTGFLIPNAKDVTSTVLAEPDKIDFATIANSRWGVVEGCEVTPQGTNTISVAAGTAVVNGKMVHVNAVSNLPVTVPNAQSRFDLIVVNELGTAMVYPGDTLDDPVFPDPEVNHTVLAAVYCTATSSDYTSNIIDKRKFLPTALFAKMPVNDDLVRNLNASGNHYRVLGDGKTSWEDDTILERPSPQTLQVTNHLNALGDITAGDDITAGGDIHATGALSGSNLIRGTSIPAGSFFPGDLFQHITNGRLYLWVGPHAGGSWQELMTSASSVPVGTIIMSMSPPASLKPYGWCPMDGQAHTEDDFPGLFTIPALQALIIGGTPRRMTVPDLSKRMLMADPTAVGRTGGVTNGMVTLTKANLPTHSHLTAAGVGGTVSTSKAGGHDIGGTIVSGTPSNYTVAGGLHTHKIHDPGHVHQGADLNGTGTSVIAVHYPQQFGTSDPGGQNKIDALFNDRSHTFSVEPVMWTMRSVTNIGITNELSAHSHTISGGAHTHTFNGDTVAAHAHTVTDLPVGNGTSFSVMPAYYTCYAYIKG